MITAVSISIVSISITNPVCSTSINRVVYLIISIIFTLSSQSWSLINLLCAILRKGWSRFWDQMTDQGRPIQALITMFFLSSVFSHSVFQVIDNLSRYNQQCSCVFQYVIWYMNCEVAAFVRLPCWIVGWLVGWDPFRLSHSTPFQRKSPFYTRASFCWNTLKVVPLPLYQTQLAIDTKHRPKNWKIVKLNTTTPSEVSVLLQWRSARE